MSKAIFNWSDYGNDVIVPNNTDPQRTIEDIKEYQKKYQSERARRDKAAMVRIDDMRNGRGVL